MPERNGEQNRGFLLRAIPDQSGGIMITEMYSGSRVYYDPKSGNLGGSEELIGKLNCMKAIDQSLPEFMKELGDAAKKK